jgi:hypothetical protein
MPPVNTIQPTFAGGEFAPSLAARVDLAKYQTGLKTCRNFIIHPHGGASNRAGFKYIAKPKYSNKKCRLIPFEFSATQAYIIEFGDLYCRFYTAGGQVQMVSAPTWVTSHSYVVGDFVTNGGLQYYCIVAHTSGTFATDLAANKWVRQDTYEIPTPYTEADLPDLKFTQSADVLFLAQGDYIPRKLTRITNTNWTLTTFDYQNGPFMIENVSATTLTASAKTGSITLTASTGIFNSSHVGSLWEIDHEFDSQTVTGSFAATGQSSTITGLGTWRLITHGTWVGIIKIEKSRDGGSTWVEVRQFSSGGGGSAADFNANTFGTDDNDGVAAIYRVNCTSYTSGTCNYNFSLDPCVTHGVVKVTAYTNSTTVTATVMKNIGATTASVYWSEGSWSGARGYPKCVAFYQDRIVFGSTDSEPQTVWLSKTGEYTNFGISDPLVDDDAISISLPSRKMNAIRNLVSLGELLVLTASSEWSVGAGSGEPITPTTVTTKAHGYRGASAIDPAVIGNRVIYIQPMGTIVRDLGYEFSSDSYTGDDVSLISNHLFHDHQIVEIAYQQEPDSLIWAVRDDGILLSLTYLREQQVIAWSWHDTDDGASQFESVATIPGTGYNELWVVTKRGADRFIEQMVERLSTTLPQDQFFVDCGITYSGSAVTTITGLGHLEGKSVAVLADGIVLPKKTVSSGQITLDVAASKVHVGLSYNSDLETMNIEIQQQDGTIQGRKVRCSNGSIRFLNSRGGKIGPSSSELYPVKLEDLNPVAAPLTLYTGDAKSSIGSGWDTGGRVFFRQDDPLPTTILAFMPSFTVGG